MPFALTLVEAIWPPPALVPILSLVVAVPPDQTGIATGMNTVTRTIGGAIGAGIAASLIAENTLASGLPAERGYTVTFALCALAAGAGLVAALLVPRRGPAVELVRAPATQAAGD